ncbi:MAG: hypothetical protein HC817_01010 [Saprospiraceae bacterium]|nr:hypothetical protein [Saprospiraceae bacterium]
METNRISYIQFQQALAAYPVFSIQDIEKIYPHFDSRRLVEWQQKEYIERLINRWYRFKIALNTEGGIWWAANRIYSPSYISMETALSFHQLIPEGVFSVTSVTTSKTQSFTTPIGVLQYQHIKPKLFYGYSLAQINGLTIKIADFEKTILELFFI